MQHVPRAGDFLWIALAALLAAAGPARAQAAGPASPAAPETYRLGTAAWPFEWSTAIGDLDADGRPDYAIADRVGRAGDRFAYAVELSITGGASRSFTFSAADSALTVSLRDVDHDRDLDLVVSALFSRAVVGVWLNDGRGEFHEVRAWPPQTEYPGDPQYDSGGRAFGEAIAWTPRTLVVLPPTPDRSTGHAPTIRIAARDSHVVAGLLSSHLRSRAPPLG